MREQGAKQVCICPSLAAAASCPPSRARSSPHARFGRRSAIVVISARAARLERQYTHMVRLCLHCGGGGGTAGHVTGGSSGAPPAPGFSGAGVVCDSLDCGVYFERRKLAHEGATLRALAERCAGMWP